MKEFIRKVCMLGDPGVGKTSLVRRYVLDEFNDKYIPSIGMKATKKRINLEDDSVALTLMIWDILGGKSKRFDHIYYKGVEGAFIVCDITRKKTMDSLYDWVSGLFEITKEVPVIFLANKIDLNGTNKKLEKKLREYVRDYDAELLFTSAKSGENVETGFLCLANMRV